MSAPFIDKKNATPFSLGILSAGQFKLFEDDNEQKIDSVSLVATSDIQVWLDNLGAHREAAYGPRGIWSTSDQAPAAIAENPEFSHLFLITYAPPASPAGSCHTINIKPHGGQLLFNKKYCTTAAPAQAPRQSTAELNELQQLVTTAGQGSIHPSAQANAFYEAPGKARVDIDIEFPLNEVKPSSWKNGTLPSALLIESFGEDGRVAAQLSEQAPEDPVFEYLNELENLKDASEALTSNRYDGQMDLPPGEYRLAIAYEHGKEFGITYVPLTVDVYDASQFAISSIALCKRVRKAGAVPVAADFVPLVAGDYEFTPAGDTVFRKGDSLMAYFELYEPTLGQPPTLHVNYTMRIRNEQTGAVALETTENADSWIQSGKSTIPVAVEPVLSKLNLAPGKYQFQIQATDSAGRKTQTRVTEFSIE
jgi:hypothetical protein